MRIEKSILLREQSLPATPASGLNSLYVDTGNIPNLLDDTGVFHQIMPTFDRLSADSAGVTSTTYVDVPGLTRAVVAGIYVLHATIVVSNTGTGNNFVSVNGPTANSMMYERMMHQDNAGVLKGGISTAYDADVSWGLTAANLSVSCVINGVFDLSANGTIAIRVKIATGTMTVKRNSFFELRKV